MTITNLAARARRDRTPTEHALEAYLRWGSERLNPETRTLLRELRAQTTDILAAGGYVVAGAMADRMRVALAADNGPVQAGCTVLETDSGSALPFPAIDDASQTGELLDESSASSEQDVAFDAVELDAWRYSSKTVRVSNELLQDSGVDIESYLAGILGARLRRALAAHCVAGDGSAKPHGVAVAAADSGVNIDISDGLSVANLLDVMHAVGAEHRASPSCAWLMGSAMHKAILTLVTGDSKPLGVWQAARGDDPERLLGHPVIVSDHMPATGVAGNRSLVFGDFSAYVIRRTAVVIQRLSERWGERNQTGFIAWMGADGDLVDPGDNPIVFADEVA